MRIYYPKSRFVYSPVGAKVAEGQGSGSSAALFVKSAIACQLVLHDVVR